MWEHFKNSELPGRVGSHRPYSAAKSAVSSEN